MTTVQRLTKPEELYVFTKTGTVVGNQVWSQTSISSTSGGGGGHLHQGSGYVSAPTISLSSSSTEKLRIFVREDDGTEFEEEFNGLGFGFRDGHRVTVLYAGDQQSQRGYTAGVINHSTSNQRLFQSSVERILPQKNGFVGFLKLAVLAATLLPVIALSAIFDTFGQMLGLALFVFAIYILFGRPNTRDLIGKEVANRLSAEMARATQQENLRPSAQPAPVMEAVQ